MLVTDVGDEICWSQVLDVHDRYDLFVNNISYGVRIGGEQHLNSVTYSV